ncbi:cellulose-binding family II protein [Thermobifida fusca TM51]|uniref:Cellulose-binding family II protein n=1 Tax=Thermobifida fusca TM51 TaxID=1169414 RepID=A0A9P2T7Z1_THEFU|nr:cellulose-binding family II protein [Thermobifida fusca TM51]
MALCALGLAFTSAATAHAQVTPDIVTTTGQPGRTVALTFDDGPNPNDTPALLSVLRKHQVKAVFCLWGEHVRQYPAIARQIAEEGHILCNHSMRHDDMGNWSAAQIRADLEATNQAIREAVPNADIPYFRAPYGSWGQSPQVAADMGMQPLGWAMDIADWEPPGTSELVRRLNERVTPGAVILLHDGGGDRSQTVQAVDQVIPQWKAQGWTFTFPAGAPTNPGPTPTPAPTPTPTPTPTPGPGNPGATCDVDYTVVNDWGHGMQGAITVSNTGSSPINNWTLQFSFSGVNISNGWNGEWSQSGSQITVHAPAWNSTLQPGQSVELGFVADKTGNVSPPSQFTLNGATCS